VLAKILIALIVAVLGLAVVITLQPATFRVTRTATIAAAPADVFALVNDFHNWDAWSPWAKLDPAMKTAYAGSMSGQGAEYSWVGNSDVGEGRMTITESQPASRVNIKLEFIKPFASVADNVFEFAPASAGTAVTWTMSGDNNFLSKAFCLFMGGMDRMIGPDFEKGLGQLKAAAEAKK
jgi:hypothetical protein